MSRTTPILTATEERARTIATRQTLPTTRVALVAIYCAIAPIYWLPGIPVEFLAYAKVALFLSSLALAIPTIASRPPKLTLLHLGLFLAACGSYVALTANSSFESVLGRTRDFLEPLLWLLVIASLPSSSRSFTRAIAMALGIFAALTLYPIAAGFSIVPDLAVPPELIASRADASPHLYTSLRTSTSGFTAVRTGWGAGVALSLTALAMLLRARTPANRTNWIALTVALIAIWASISVGARGATLATLVIMVFYLLRGAPARLAAAGLLTVAVLVANTQLATFLPTRFHFSLDQISDFADVDRLLAGRLTTFSAAIENFAASPVFGVGTENAMVIIPNGPEIVTVHNIWLRALAEGGIFIGIPVLIATLGLLNIVFDARAQRTPPTPDLRPVILLGLLMGLLEPGVVFGSFNMNLVLWTAVGIALNASREHARRHHISRA